MASQANHSTLSSSKLRSSESSATAAARPAPPTAPAPTKLIAPCPKMIEDMRSLLPMLQQCTEGHCKQSRRGAVDGGGRHEASTRASTRQPRPLLQGTLEGAGPAHRPHSRQRPHRHARHGVEEGLHDAHHHTEAAARGWGGGRRGSGQDSRGRHAYAVQLLLLDKPRRAGSPASAPAPSSLHAHLMPPFCCCCACPPNRNAGLATSTTPTMATGRPSSTPGDECSFRSKGLHAQGGESGGRAREGCAGVCPLGARQQGRHSRVQGVAFLPPRPTAPPTSPTSPPAHLRAATKMGERNDNTEASASGSRETAR